MLPPAISAIRHPAIAAPADDSRSSPCPTIFLPIASRPSLPRHACPSRRATRPASRVRLLLWLRASPPPRSICRWKPSRRALSSAELTQWMLERIERWQPAINAFVRIEADEALAAAKAADRALARGKAKGPLHGVPLAHKDMYYVKGKVSECGSKVRAGWVAPATSTALARLHAAGSFRIGGLHMSEFAYSPTGHNSYLGPACNAWDPRCITGGSSSGSGTAVAARLVPAALGSDTGGSIRLPAHFCGVTGFKPTNGRVSRANALPLSFTLDTVGPLTVSAEDAGLIMGVIAGPDPLDPTTLGAPPWNAKRTRGSPKGLKIGVPTRGYVEDLEPDIAAALAATIDTLRKLGAKISKVELPD